MYKRLLLLLMIPNIFLNAQMLSRTKVDMGTFITISLSYGNQRFIEDGFEIINDVNMALSSYNKQATIYKLNHLKNVEIDSYTYEALQLSQNYYYKTEHYFNIAIGSITKDLYNFGEDEQIPSENQLKDSNIDLNGLFFNKQKAVIQEGITIDLGGMGKGFGVDKVAEYFIENNITEGIIAASGDIRCLDICPIEVQNPFLDSRLASFRTLRKNSSISTSGNYNRFIKSVKNNHLINPKTKKPQNKFISITLISQLQNSDIDAYSTAASVMDIKEAFVFLDSLELAYIVLLADKTLVVSKNIAQFTQNLLIDYAYKQDP